MAGTVMKGTLDGFRVVDLTCSMAGAYAGRLMADFGATVERIELMESDGTLHRAGCLAAGEYAGAFDGYLNLGKHQVEIDLTSSDDRTSFVQLLEAADVVLR